MIDDSVPGDKVEELMRDQKEKNGEIHMSQQNFKQDGYSSQMH